MKREKVLYKDFFKEFGVVIIAVILLTGLAGGYCVYTSVQREAQAKNDSQEISVLLEDGFDIFLNGEKANSDEFRVESLELKDYNVTFDYEAKEIYIKGKQRSNRAVLAFLPWL